MTCTDTVHRHTDEYKRRKKKRRGLGGRKTVSTFQPAASRPFQNVSTTTTTDLSGPAHPYTDPASPTGRPAQPPTSGSTCEARGPAAAVGFQNAPFSDFYQVQSPPSTLHPKRQEGTAGRKGGGVCVETLTHSPPPQRESRASICTSPARPISMRRLIIIVILTMIIIRLYGFIFICFFLFF